MSWKDPLCGDWDLEECLTYNPQDLLPPGSVKRVLARVEGENDGGSWGWVVERTDKTPILLIGGCDYTGGD